MKPIPGYEIIYGECKDCAFSGIDCDNMDTECEDECYKIYKKIEEKTMTHDEMIAVIQAHKEERDIQFRVKGRGCWKNDIPLWNFADCEYRIKPETKIIRWTADDWREFKDIKLKIDDAIFEVSNWHKNGIAFINIRKGERYLEYNQLVNKKDTNGKPCGKVVEE